MPLDHSTREAIGSQIKAIEAKLNVNGALKG
jgi:hypothetical protein